MGAYFKALAEVEAEGKIQVPDHLKDATRDAKALGHGKDYKYPHEFPEHWIEQQYLPDSLRDKHFYEPSDQGREKEIAEQWRKRRGENNA
jgi:putative ATPase